MKTSHVSLLAAGCLAVTLIAAEPDASPAPSATPAASPAKVLVRRHRRHHVAVTPSPTPAATATPARHKWWEFRKSGAKASAAPSASPSATPAKKHHAKKVAASPSPEPSATPEASATPEPSATPKPKATPKPNAAPTPKATSEPSAAPTATTAKSKSKHPAAVAASPAPAASASPAATPGKPQKKSWMSSLFKHGAKKEKPIAQPSPTAAVASPTPRKHRKKPATAAEASASPGEAPGATPAPDNAGQPKSMPEETPAEQAAPPTKKRKNGEMTSTVPFVPPPSAMDQQQQAPVVETKSPMEIEADETKRFQAAKAKALADPKVQELQGKADSAIGDDAKGASRRYYKALYDKMRDIDPSVKDRIDRTEAAAMKRADQEQ